MPAFAGMTSYGWMRVALVSRSTANSSIAIEGPLLPKARSGHAGAGANVGSAFGKGLKVNAIRKAPIPIAQEPM
jgi:hypothetical protein